MLNLMFFFSILLSSFYLRAQNIGSWGWPGSLEPLYSQLDKNPQKNYFVLLSRIPTLVLDARTENGYRNSVTQWGFAEQFHPGHVMVGWKCNSKNNPFVSFVGFNGDVLTVNNQLQEGIPALVKAGFGITTLFARYNDGFIERPDQLDSIFQEVTELYYENKPEKQAFKYIATVIEISTQDCADVVNKVNMFQGVLSAKSSFGLNLDAEKLEGAACNSFASSMMTEVQALKKLIPHFKRLLKFPSYMFGNTQVPQQNIVIDAKYQVVANGKKISKLKLAVADWSPSSVDENVDFNFIDSEMILLWQRQFLMANIQLWPNSEEFVVDWKKAYNRQFWERDFDPYLGDFKGNKLTKVDRFYDAKAKNIVDHAIQLIKNSKLSYMSVMGFPVTIIENL